MGAFRTLHVDAEVSWGGGERQVAGLCSHLQERGHEVKLICRPASKLREWATAKGIESCPAEMKSTFVLSSILKLRSIIARERPDILHLHTSRAHVLGSMAGKLAGVKTIIATRRMDDPIKMLWPNTGAYGAWTTAIVAISEAVRDVLISCGVDPSKIRLIPSGADISQFVSACADQSVRAEFGGSAPLRLICTAASLSVRKGVRYLLEAAALLKDSTTQFRVIIAGEGDQRAELEQMTKRLGIDCMFLGFYPDMARLLANIDIFVMPSLSEGLGVAVLEAMAAGKPVVASAVGGLKESVLGGKTGFLVPPADPQSLADAIKKLLVTPTLAEQFGAAGRARVRENYSLKNMALANESLYHELVKR